MKKITFKILVLVFSIIFQIVVWGQGEEGERISVSSSVDQSRITIGDLIRYTVTVTHDENVEVEMPGLGVNLGQFEVRDYEVQDPYKKDGMVISEAEYIISTFFTGEFEIPPLTVTYRTAEDSTMHTLTTEKIKIVVESVKPSEAGDIRDIKSPVEIPRDWWLLGRWFVLGGMIIMFGVFMMILYRRKKQGKGLLPRKEQPPRPPHEVAYENLERLRESDLLEKGAVKEYYIAISEIIRRYIEGRYFVVAMELTTFEVMEGLSQADLPEEEYQLFSTFLSQCDLVKFAKYMPSEKENEAIMDLAFEIIDKTKVIIELPLLETNEESVPSSGNGEERLVSSVESANEAQESHTLGVK
ncbi:hypothetical protein JW824_08850 [bacterium]|nr:hypothetical protein [bacterium]